MYSRRGFSILLEVSVVLTNSVDSKVLPFYVFEDPQGPKAQVTTHDSWTDLKGIKRSRVRPTTDVD